MPAPSPDQNQAFARVLTHADRLFEALEDLEAAGGLKGFSGRIKPSSIEKAADVLRSVRRAIDGQLAGLKGPRTRPTPRPSTIAQDPATDPRPAPDGSDSVPIRRARSKPGD